MVKKEEKNIPSGSEVPVNAGETQDAGTNDAGTKTEEKPNEEVKSLQEQLANSQKLIGKQGTELGELRQQQQAMSEQMTAKADENKGDDYEMRLSQIQEQVESGEIDFGQALSLTARLSAEMGANQASTAFKLDMEQRESRKVQADFLDANPDFTELQQSGALNDLKTANPMHDDVSAYYEFKRTELEQSMADAVAAAKAEGEQSGANMADQARKAGNVIGKQGAGVRDQNKPTTFNSPQEKKEAMVEALRAARSG